MYAAAVHTLSLSDAVVIVGAVVFGLTSFKAGRLKILRETNEDLQERNKMLEEKSAELESALAIERSKPNLEMHAKLLEKLLERLQKHDENMAVAVERSQIVFERIVEKLDAIGTAVIPPS